MVDSCVARYRIRYWNFTTHTNQQIILTRCLKTWFICNAFGGSATPIFSHTVPYMLSIPLAISAFNICPVHGALLAVGILCLSHHESSQFGWVEDSISIYVHVAEDYINDLLKRRFIMKDSLEVLEGLSRRSSHWSLKFRPVLRPSTYRTRFDHMYFFGVNQKLCVTESVKAQEGPSTPDPLFLLLVTAMLRDLSTYYSQKRSDLSMNYRIQ